MVDDVGAGYGNEDEPEKCRKQGNAPADWLEQLIEDQRNTDIARIYDELARSPKSIQRP